jgi:hypothetical protein
MSINRSMEHRSVGPGFELRGPTEQCSMLRGSRRDWLRTCGMGGGMLGLQTLLAASNPLTPSQRSKSTMASVHQTACRISNSNSPKCGNRS